MTVTVEIDPELLLTAERFTHITDKSALVREALHTLIAREAALIIERLGGTAPDFGLPGRPFPPP